MLAIRVTIERFIDDSQPGWVKCSFTDAAGNFHAFEEKVPVVSNEDLDANSKYPRTGIIGCEVVRTRITPEGRELMTVDTERPWGIESKAGETCFEVFRDQLVGFNGKQDVSK